MPEGDSVLRTAHRLDARLAGVVLTHCDLRVPRFSTVDLSGRRYLETGTYGKHLFHRIDGGLTLHTHLRMDGSWRVIDAGETSAPTQAARRAEQSHTTRALLYTARAIAVGDKLGVVEVMRSADEKRVTEPLGPDLLSPSWSPEAADEAVTRVIHSPAPDVAGALLDQRNVAGLGTIWVSEGLFAAGLSPLAKPHETNLEPLRTALDFARTTMLAGVSDAAVQESRADVVGRSSRARPNHQVYGRAGQPCRGCGTLIRRVPAGDGVQQRHVFGCPSCQPG